MKKRAIIFDSFALITYFLKQAGWQRVYRFLLEAEKEKREIYFSELSLGELYYMVYRKAGKSKASKVLDFIQATKITKIKADLKTILKAAEFKEQYKISYADAFVLELSQRFSAPIVTSDPEFKQIKGIKLISLS